MLTGTQKYSVEHNIVTRLRDQGLTMQEAVDEVGRRLERCFVKWHTAHAEIPSWGDAIDAQVPRLIDVYRDVALGCLHWR